MSSEHPILPSLPPSHSCLPPDQTQQLSNLIFSSIEEIRAPSGLLLPMPFPASLLHIPSPNIICWQMPWGLQKRVRMLNRSLPGDQNDPSRSVALGGGRDQG